MDLAALFESFYSKFVLRDLFGKIVPGMLLLFGVCLGLLDMKTVGLLISDLTFGVWIVTAGFSWLLGFVVQYVGEGARLLRTHPKGVGKTRNEFHPDLAMFHDNSSSREAIHAERLNIIKEACGNGAVSLGIATLVYPAGAWISNICIPVKAYLPLFLIAASAVCLWRMHIEHVERFGDFVCNTNKHRKYDVRATDGEKQGGEGGS